MVAWMLRTHLVTRSMEHLAPTDRLAHSMGTGL